MLYGLDLSSVQGGTVDFHAVRAAGITFVIVKAVTGNAGVDPKFVHDVEAAEAAGLIVFAYVFLYPLPPAPNEPLHDPKAQAAFHVSFLQEFRRPGRYVFVDAEWPVPPDLTAKWHTTPAAIVAWYHVYLPELARLLGYDPGFYTYEDFWEHVLAATGDMFFATYPLWMADYPAELENRWPTDAEKPRALAPWGKATFWQVAGGKGMRVAGLTVDRDVFLGSLEELRRLVGLNDDGSLPVDPANANAAAVDELFDPKA